MKIRPSCIGSTAFAISISFCSAASGSANWQAAWEGAIGQQQALGDRMLFAT
jgi:hypothetical protein